MSMYMGPIPELCKRSLFFYFFGLLNADCADSKAKFGLSSCFHYACLKQQSKLLGDETDVEQVPEQQMDSSIKLPWSPHSLGALLIQ